MKVKGNSHRPEETQTGSARIPDYIQLRDEQMTLIGYFRPERLERLASVVRNTEHAAKIQQLIETIPDYGRLTRIEV
jgi:hypothetical protein